MAENTQQPFTITIEKPYSGWIPTMANSLGHGLLGTFELSNSYSGYQEYSYSVAMMPNRPGFEGHLAPGPGFSTATDAGGNVTGLALNAVTESDGTTYVILDNNNYVTLNLSGTPTVSSSVYGVIGAAVGIHGTHTNFATYNGDVAAFPAIIGTQVAYTGGTAYAYFSWEDNVDGDVAVYNGPSNTGTANFYTSLGGAPLIKGIPHPMFNFGDKFIYVGNGQALNQIVPSLGTFQNNALILPPQWVIQSMTQYQNFIAIGAWQQNGSPEAPSDQGRVAMFLWDGLSGTFNFQYDLKDFFVSNLFYDGSNLFALTYGRNGTTKLKQFNGQSFDIVWESAIIGIPPANNLHNNSPVQGGVDLWLNHVTWTSGTQGGATGGGMINSYGSPSQNIPPGFHNPTTLNFSGGRNGMCKNLYGNLLLVGSYNGSSYSIQYSDFTKFIFNSQFVSPLTPLPTNSTIDNVKLYFSQWTTGAAMNISIMKDYNQTTYGSAPDLLQWSPTAITYGTTTTYFYKSQSIPNLNAFCLATEWIGSSAAIIRKIEINGFSDPANI